MPRVLVIISSGLLLGLACVPSPDRVPAPAPLGRPISFLADVKPVFDTRCVVCHSCYNAPCQLKLGAYEGVDRGGSKRRVYSASRLDPAQPTRLFTDARSTSQWRERGFHSVLESRAEGPYNDSLLHLMLEAKRRRPELRGEYRAEAKDLSCPADRREAKLFLTLHPDRGMPFALPPLRDEAHRILAGWIAAGAPGPTAEEQRALTMPSPADAAEIERWETFLNRPDPKHVMTARYLYEHFYLAHLRFAATGSNDF